VRVRAIVGPVGCRTPIAGRIAAKGLADELNDRRYLIVDGIDGRAHYLVLRGWQVSQQSTALKFTSFGGIDRTTKCALALGCPNGFTEGFENSTTSCETAPCVLEDASQCEAERFALEF
jgi:hypothetical protein